jgi:chromosome segregation ATPase
VSKVPYRPSRPIAWIRQKVAAYIRRAAAPSIAEAEERLIGRLQQVQEQSQQSERLIGRLQQVQEQSQQSLIQVQTRIANDLNATEMRVLERANTVAIELANRTHEASLKHDALTQLLQQRATAEVRLGNQLNTAEARIESLSKLLDEREGIDVRLGNDLNAALNRIAGINDLLDEREAVDVRLANDLNSTRMRIEGIDQLLDERESTDVQLANELNASRTRTEELSGRILFLERCLGIEGELDEKRPSYPPNALAELLELRLSQLEARLMTYLEGPYFRRLSSSTSEHASPALPSKPALT